MVILLPVRRTDSKLETVPDQCRKNRRSPKSDRLVQVDSVLIGCSHSETHGRAAHGLKLDERASQEFIPEMGAADCREDTKLSDVSGMPRDSARKAGPRNLACMSVAGNEGRLSRKHTASGIANDIRQEVTSARNRPILVVNLRIDVASICRRHQVRRFFLIPFDPRVKGCSRISAKLLQAGNRRRFYTHEQPIMTADKSGKRKRPRTVAEEHQLGFDALDA